MPDKLEILKADRRASFHKLMFPVLKEATKMSNSNNKQGPWENSIFSYNEISAVSILSSAAWRRKFISFAEYATEKKARPNSNETVIGRVDLWIMGNKKSYSFEFKFSWNNFSLEAINYALESAKEDARLILENEADCRVGGLIANTYHLDEKSNAFRILQNFGETENNCRFAYMIGSKPENTATFFFFGLL